jgi:hypothetical protein
MRRFAPTSKRSKSPVGVISRSAKAEQQRDQGSLTRAAIEKDLRPDEQQCTRCAEGSRSRDCDEMAHAVRRGAALFLLDLLVSMREQERRDGEAERLGGPKVDDQFECRRLLDRQIGRLDPAQKLYQQSRQ